MESKLEYLKFLIALLETAHKDGNEYITEYLHGRVDAVIAEAFEAGATQEQVDVALGIVSA